MKKKQMLATLVMLSLLQGSVYAETINPGIHDKYVSVNIDGDQRTIINIPDEYNFKGGLSIDRNINASMDKYNSIIGLESSANDSDKKLEITIGSENADSDKVNIKLNSNSQKNLNNTLIQVGGNGNKFKNIIEINLKNADMFLEGNNYYAAIASRDFYNPISNNTNGDIKIIGDNNSNLFISGNMHMGVYSSGNGELIIKGINDFIITKNTAYYEDGQVIFSDDIAAISAHSDKSCIEANNLTFNPQCLPSELTKESTYDKIILLSKESITNQDLKEIVNLAISIHDLEEQAETTAITLGGVEGINERPEYLEALTQIRSGISKLYALEDSHEQTLTIENPELTRQLIKEEQKKYLKRRELSTLDID